MNEFDPDAGLDAQAAAFAQLLGLAPNDLNGAYRQAVALAEGLFPHQVEGVAFLLGRRRAILADDMGLGKTRQAIVALRQAAPGGPVARRVPRIGEAQLGARDRAGAPRRLGPRRRGRGAAPVADVGVGDRELRHPVEARRCARALPWAGIVFDEAHYLKNHTSARSKLARELAEQAARTRRGSRPCTCSPARR